MRNEPKTTTEVPAEGAKPLTYHLEATELTKNKEMTPGQKEIDEKLNSLSMKALNSTQMIDTAISNIIGNIELLMQSYDPTSSEYANLCSLKEEVEELSRGMARWQFP